jgi:hypothetical protein
MRSTSGLISSPIWPDSGGDRARGGCHGHDLRLGPLSGLHINPAVTSGFTARGVFPTKWVLPHWVVQFAGAICAALFLQLMFGDVSVGGNYPITTPTATGARW